MSRNSRSLESAAPAASSNRRPLSARHILLCGQIQGLGVRPAIFRLAVELALRGQVSNTSGGVEIVAEGSEEQLSAFYRRLPDALPDGARLDGLTSEAIEPVGFEGFDIVKDSRSGPLRAPVPCDRAVCTDCLREVHDPADRRFRYPFTSCTACGPRETIIRSMPYERSETTMAAFPLCRRCKDESTRPSDRRFHAQTNACPQCGPHVWCVDDLGRNLGERDAAVDVAVRALRAGQIVALRGLGGYQLLVDAQNDAACRRLRERKGRPAKPLAVMVQSLPEARRLACVDPIEADLLAAPSNPIVLLQARAGNGLAASIHPQLDTVGVMLPTTPLHDLIVREFRRPLVCTSGNRDGEPLACAVEEAEERLAGVCDLWLHHDREIARPLDDSVVRVTAGRQVTLRLARGMAPLRLELEVSQPLLATGGHLKAALAWSNGVQSVLGPHLGDLQALRTRQRFLSEVDRCRQLYRFEPRQIVCDAHPEYFTSVWAEEQKLPTLSVQHHYAHIAAGMLQEGWLDRTVLGVSWDGTGYGTDGTIWGGEFLMVGGGGWQRVGSLRPFRLPGGEAAIRQPWRTALSLLHETFPNDPLERFPLSAVDESQRRIVLQLDRSGYLSPVTTSAGRLFDAVGVLLLGASTALYEGELPMRLEAIADRRATGSYRLPPLRRAGTWELDWRPLIAALVRDLRSGVGTDVIAMRFHRAMAEGIVAVCRHWPAVPIVLGGGVFQNRLLTELLAEKFAAIGRKAALPGPIPPGDGGLAAGQLAAAVLATQSTKSGRSIRHPVNLTETAPRQPS